jgi:hypothetical protein
LTFVLLGVTAVMLQAWLWGFPMENGHSTAPRMWTRIHRVVGLSFVAIYITMMFFMVPRLWEYQVELPARTVFHAVAAIVIGVLLLTKLAIIRLFPHFMGALPRPRPRPADQHRHPRLALAALRAAGPQHLR